MAVNYYTLLELNVDTFVKDIPTLESRLELVKQKWNRSNNTDIRAYVSAYYTSGVVRAAFSNPDEWRRIYEQAKRDTDANIATFIMITSGKGFMYESELNACSSNKDIYASPEYVRRAAESQGVRIEPDGGKPAAKPSAQKQGAKLSDYQPKSALAFNAANKALGIVRCADMYEFLRRYSKMAGLSVNTAYNAYTPAAECAACAEDILKAWAGRKENDEKSAIDTICTVIKHFDTPDDKHSQENYNRSLIFGRLKAILDELWRALSQSPEDSRIINAETETMFIKRLSEIIDSTGKAASVLHNFCDEKGIVISSGGVRADKVLCPFCSNSFEKQDGKMPMSCPVCRHTFLVECPKCGKVANMAEKSECCGFDLSQYPRLSRMCFEAMGYVNTLSFDFADMTLNEVERVWKGFPEVRPVREALTQKKNMVGQMVGRLEKHMERSEFYSAKAEYERIQRSVVGYSDPAVEMRIKTAVNEAQTLFEQFRKETDRDKRLRLLIMVRQAAADHPGADTELSRIPPAEITELTVTADLNSCCTDLRWSSDDPEGTVEYEVRRKPFGKPVSTDDGTLVVRTTEKGFSDSGVKEGSAYYYAVFAMRGRNKTAMRISEEPAVFFPVIRRLPEVTCDESSIQARWQVSAGSMSAEVFRCGNAFSRSYGDGIRLTDADAGGFVDTGLMLGCKYYYNVFFTIAISGRRFISKPYTVSGETVRKGMPVSFVLKADSNSRGKYELTVTEGAEYLPQVRLYRSNNGNVPSGTSASLKQLTDSMGFSPLDSVPSGENSLAFVLPEGVSCFVYAVTVSGASAVTGGCARAENLRQLSVSSVRTDGVNLCIELEQWPKGHELLYVCWRFDRHPVSITEEGTAKTSVSRMSYSSSGIIIPNIEEQDYFITGFVRDSTGEKAVFRTEYRNHKKTDMTYEFIYGGLIRKQLKIRIAMSVPSPLPQLSLRGMMGAVPVYESSGSEICTIPACSDKKQVHEFTLSGSLDRNMHGKLFLTSPEDKEKYRLLLKTGETTLLTD